MLDSLVRVSRRVGWGADRLARDPEQVRESRTTAQQAVSEHCEQSTQVERATRGRGPSCGGCSSVRECGRLRPVPKRSYSRESRSYLGQTVYRHPRTGPGGYPLRKGALRRPPTRQPVHENQARRAASERQVEFKGETCGPIRLPLNGFTYS
jgi:hypothetical protein